FRSAIGRLIHVFLARLASGAIRRLTDLSGLSRYFVTISWTGLQRLLHRDVPVHVKLSGFAPLPVVDLDGKLVLADVALVWCISHIGVSHAGDTVLRTLGDPVTRKRELGGRTAPRERPLTSLVTSHAHGTFVTATVAERARRIVPRRHACSV